MKLKKTLSRDQLSHVIKELVGAEEQVEPMNVSHDIGKHHSGFRKSCKNQKGSFDEKNTVLKALERGTLLSNTAL